jgi:two-component system response regulator RegX3
MIHRVLLCHTDPQLFGTVRDVLRGADIETDAAPTVGGLTARDDLDAFAAVIVGMGLAEAHGFDVCRAVRKASDVPLIVLTPVHDGIECVVCMEIGADAYISVPFSVDEFQARIVAVLRRSGEAGFETDCGAKASCGDLQLDLASYEATLGGRRLDLTPKEFELLHILVRNAGQVVRSRDLLMQVWGYNEHIRTRTLDVHVGRLRAKIEPDRSAPRYIVTVPAVGYKLELAA